MYKLYTEQLMNTYSLHRWTLIHTAGSVPAYWRLHCENRNCQPKPNSLYLKMMQNSTSEFCYGISRTTTGVRCCSTVAHKRSFFFTILLLWCRLMMSATLCLCVSVIDRSVVCVSSSRATNCWHRWMLPCNICAHHTLWHDALVDQQVETNYSIRNDSNYHAETDTCLTVTTRCQINLTFATAIAYCLKCR